MRLAHSLAIASEMVRADMIESIEFPELANRYRVQGVPKTVINEETFLEGADPEPLFAAKVLEAVGMMTADEVAKLREDLTAEGEADQDQ